MGDGNFWHLGGVTRWNSQFSIHSWTFLAIIFVASQLFLCLFWISLLLWIRCLQHPCSSLVNNNLYKFTQASKNSNSNAQLHFFSNLLTHSWFYSMLFALLRYQVPYIVMNRCLYLNRVMCAHKSCYVFTWNFILFWQKQYAPFVMCPLDLFVKSRNYILGELAEWWGWNRNYEVAQFFFRPKLTC